MEYIFYSKIGLLFHHKNRSNKCDNLLKKMKHCSGSEAPIISNDRSNFILNSHNQFHSLNSINYTCLKPPPTIFLKRYKYQVKRPKQSNHATPIAILLNYIFQNDHSKHSKLSTKRLIRIHLVWLIYISVVMDIGICYFQ